MSFKKNIPMAITSVRFLVSPLIFIALLSHTSYGTWCATGLFIVGSLTDWLDGYWARKFNAESNLGKFMDPIADKILVLSALIVLLYEHRIDPITPALLLARDIFIGGLRAVAAADRVIIAAKPTGKWKTGLQMVAIPCLFLDIEIAGISLRAIGLWGLWISVGLSLFSGVEYSLGYFRGVQQK